MLRHLVPFVALLVGAIQVQPAAAQSGADLVKLAVEAQGGADALRALKSLTIRGAAKHWEPGQSHVPGGEPRFIGDSTFVTTGDVATRSVRVEWDRDRKYPQVVRHKFTEIITPRYGVLINDKGEQSPMSGVLLASHHRELSRGSPFLMLRALDNPQSIVAMPDQNVGDRSLPAVTIAVGNARLIVMFDRATKLPAVIRTRDDEIVYGDSNYDLTLSDWKSVGGAKLAHALSFRLNDTEVQRLTYNEVVANPTIAADAFAVKDDVKAKAPAPAADPPYQMAIRRTFTGGALNDGIYLPPGGSLRLVELAPNVQHVVGASHNNLIVAMKDGLVVFDAPYNDLQSRWVIDAAKQKYPGKPIKQLVLMHHHIDHTGGTRAYVAEGAELVIPAQARAFFEQMVAAKHTVTPDALAKSPKPAKIVDVKETLTLKDDTMTINLYNIPNPHADGMLIAHVAGPNILFITDLISPRGPIARTPATVAVGAALRKYNINDALIAGAHGTTAKQAEIGPALAAN